MNTFEESSEPRRRRRYRLNKPVVAGLCAAVVASTGFVAVHAHAEVPDEQVGFQGCTGIAIAASGNVSFTLPDAVTGQVEVPDAPPAGSDQPNLDIDEENSIPLQGVVDMSEVSVTCNIENRATLLKGANFAIKLIAADVSGVACIPGLNRGTKDLTFDNPTGTITHSVKGVTQCDNPIEITVLREARTFAGPV
jgi:hypothetical protein